MIEAKNIFKYINNKKILDDVSINLNRAEITILFGSSGCGKTTLCRHLLLLDLADKGTISVDNIKYNFPLKTREISLSNKTNMVFQQLFLWPHLTNEENIKLAINNFDKSKQKIFDKLIELLNIQEILTQYPNESSVGQKQRIAIARVLILEPEYIFLDEMTSALDIVQTNKILKLLEKLKSNGIGMLIITHNLSFIEKLADKVVFMDKGKIIETGDKNLLNNPKTHILKEFLRL